MVIAKQTCWRSKPRRCADSLAFIPWLLDRGSLTAQIQARGRFEVILLRQGLGQPTCDEAALLGITANQQAWIREVALYCDGQPLVFAHTVLPYQPRGPLTGWLARLGNRSLGALLFSHAGFSRGELTCRRLDQRHVLFRRATEAMQLTTTPPNNLWARRSVFSYGRQAVLVSEIFSPALQSAGQADSPPGK
ncbi:MAG: chorismate lyase [Betaproteobacteria bacterium]